LCVGERNLKIPTELEAFSNKTAALLATSIERLLRHVSDTVILPVTGGDAQLNVWLVHILIGDGIGTNNAAAKFVWSCVMQRPLGRGVTYSLILVRCGVHSTALSARFGVTGEGARAAARGTDPEEEGVTATAVRLFKYVIGDYYEELLSSMRAAVYATSGALPGGLESILMDLREVYTSHVIPDWLVEYASTPLAARNPNDLIVGQAKHCYCNDESPTLSRFFTFRGCCDKMNTMELLGLPQAFVVRGVHVRPEGQTRLRRIRAFFDRPSGVQALKRACLVLHITGAAEA
jgi:hypothetical protein